MSAIDRESEFPMPDNLEDALVEIRVLRNRLNAANERTAKQFEKRLLEVRGIKGNLKALAKQNNELRSQIAELTKKEEN